jgi:predicted lysophospholipase L1 biosynthesis ABC-type transport system permease subunit
MIRTLKMWGARALFLLALTATLGFGVIAAALGVVIGGLLLLGLRLTAGSVRPEQPQPAEAQAA